MLGRHIFIVPGYRPSRTPELWKYADAVSQSINKEYPDLVIFSGGESQRATNPGVTEAGLLWEMVRSKLLHHQHIILETEALTSLDNIINVAPMIRQWVPTEGVAESIVTISCEWNRRWKMYFLAWLALPEYRGRIKVVPVRWERGLLPCLKQAVSTFGELVAFFWPWLAERGRESRRRCAQRT